MQTKLKAELKPEKIQKSLKILHFGFFFKYRALQLLGIATCDHEN